MSLLGTRKTLFVVASPHKTHKTRAAEQLVGSLKGHRT